MKRIGKTSSGNMRGRLYILAAAVMLILLFTTSLSTPGSMSADKQHDQEQTGQHPKDQPASGQEGDSSPGQGGPASTSEQASVQCGVLKLDQPGEGIGQIPLYCISGAFYGEITPPNVPHKDLPILRGTAIPVPELAHWGAFFLNEGSNHGYLLLAPRHWKVVTADTGMDGSVKIELQDPSNPQIRMTYLDTGSCGGCAIQRIGSYFPGMKAWAEEQGMVPDLPAFENRSMLNEHVVQYRMQKDAEAYQTFGAAYRFTGQDHTAFSMLEIEAPEAQLKVVQNMLDFFSKYPAAFVY